MLKLLRTRAVFFVAAFATAGAAAYRLAMRGAAEAPTRIITPSMCLWLAGGLLLLMAAGIVWARKRGQAALPATSTLWSLLIYAAACDVLCNLAALSIPAGLPLSVFLTMASICLLWGLLRRLSLLYWFAFFALQLAQQVGYAQYGSRINSLVLAETIESSGEEALAYLSPQNMLICVSILVISGLLCWLLTLILRHEKKRIAMLNGALLWAACACLFAPAMPKERLDDYWPAYESYLLYHAWTEALFHNQATIKQAESLPSPTNSPSSMHTLKGDEGLILVVHIGESVRADRMSLNGYERDTTPWLRRQERLINFPQCISAACDTCQAQIAILTDARRDIYENDPAMLPHTGSVLELFQTHGFKVYSFFGKRNATQLKYDRVVRILTRCSEKRFHAPGSPWTSVPQMADTLHRLDPKQNAIIFINNEGSHTPFYHYDRENPPFSPASSIFENPASHAEAINNAYDSTVHYTDEFVRRVVNLLHGRPWAYLYISDHGEYLGHDGIWGRAGLGESQRDYHSTSGCRVGMFLITSPDFEQLHPHIATALQNIAAHADMTIGHEHIFHTLLGLFDLHTPFYTPTLDLSSPHVQPYTGPHPMTDNP